MRFGDLRIGQKFLCDREIYFKKTLSSAYVLSPITLEIVTSPEFFHHDDRGSFCGFSAAVHVHALAEESE